MFLNGNLITKLSYQIAMSDDILEFKGNIDVEICDEKIDYFIEIIVKLQYTKISKFQSKLEFKKRVYLIEYYGEIDYFIRSIYFPIFNNLRFVDILFFHYILKN